MFLFCAFVSFNYKRVKGTHELNENKEAQHKEQGTTNQGLTDDEWANEGWKMNGNEVKRKHAFLFHTSFRSSSVNHRCQTGARNEPCVSVLFVHLQAKERNEGAREMNKERTKHTRVPVT